MAARSRGHVYTPVTLSMLTQSVSSILSSATVH
jgi:hypothetical protein